MPLTVSFTATQPVGEPSVVTITDTSTGVDAAVTQRRVYLAKDDGTFLVPSGTSTDYIQWSYADSSIDIDALVDRDYALLITVEWLNVSNTVLYNTSQNKGFTSFNEDFDYQLTQMLSGNPLLVNDANFFQSKSDLRTEIDSGDKAITRADDIYGAQQCYDRATNLRLNSQYYFPS